MIALLYGPSLWDWQALGALVAIGALIIGAVAYLVARYKQESQKEWMDLAQVRAEKIDDLVAEIASLRSHFESEIGELRGQVEALRSFKADEIATAVANKLEGLWA